MQEYKIKNSYPLPDAIILPVVSVLLGAGIGILSHFISQIFYLALIYPVLLSYFASRSFIKITQYIKVPNNTFNALCGLGMGVMIVFFFHYAQYYENKNSFIQSLQEYEGLQYREAELYFYHYQESLTGQRGLIGYWMLQAKDGEKHTVTILHSGIIGQTFSYTLKNWTYWIYWGIEAVIIIGLIPKLIVRHKRFFNEQEHLWYGQYPKQIGTVEMVNSQKFLDLLKSDNLKSASSYIVLEENIQHPLWEIYHYILPKSLRGYKLLEIVQTRRINPTTVKRNPIFRCELTQSQAEFFTK